MPLLQLGLTLSIALRQLSLALRERVGVRAVAWGVSFFVATPSPGLRPPSPGGRGLIRTSALAGVHHETLEQRLLQPSGLEGLVQLQHPLEYPLQLAHTVVPRLLGHLLQEIGVYA